MGRQFRQGYYEVKDWDKYVGQKKPRYLSSYELEFFSWCDRSPSIIKWGAEIVVVPYFNPVKNRKARYIVDVYIKYRDREGNIREELIEIKPLSQTKKPTKGRKRKDVYGEQLATWYTNQAKWKAASEYAKARGWSFRVVTEKSIFR